MLRVLADNVAAIVPIVHSCGAVLSESQVLRPSEELGMPVASTQVAQVAQDARQSQRIGQVEMVNRLTESGKKTMKLGTQLGSLGSDCKAEVSKWRHPV